MISEYLHKYAQSFNDEDIGYEHNIIELDNQGQVVSNTVITFLEDNDNCQFFILDNIDTLKRTHNQYLLQDNKFYVTVSTFANKYYYNCYLIPILRGNFHALLYFDFDVEETVSSNIFLQRDSYVYSKLTLFHNSFKYISDEEFEMLSKDNYTGFWNMFIMLEVALDRHIKTLAIEKSSKKCPLNIYTKKHKYNEQDNYIVEKDNNEIILSFHKYNINNKDHIMVQLNHAYISNKISIEEYNYLYDQYMQLYLILENQITIDQFIKRLT